MLIYSHIQAHGQPAFGSSSSATSAYICLRKRSEMHTSAKRLIPQLVSVLISDGEIGAMGCLALILGRSKVKVPEILCSSYLLCDGNFAQLRKFLDPDFNLHHCQNVNICSLSCDQHFVILLKSSHNFTSYSSTKQTPAVTHPPWHIPAATAELFYLLKYKQTFLSNI